MTAKTANLFDDNRVQSIVDIMTSLNIAMMEAKGTPITTDRLKKMNALELLNIIAPNGIRFNFNKNLVLK